MLRSALWVSIVVHETDAQRACRSAGSLVEMAARMHDWPHRACRYQDELEHGPGPNQPPNLVGKLNKEEQTRKLGRAAEMRAQLQLQLLQLK